jgi:hypothetical protein
VSGPVQIAAHIPERSARPPAACIACRHFASDAATLERELPGLVSMGSGYGSVRANDGICRRHDRYVSASHYCEQFLQAPV